MPTLLFVDDDIELLEIISAEFSKKDFTIYTLSSAVDIAQQVEKLSPDCIILDVMMPQIDGFTALKNIRAKVETPVIFLTGKISEDDKVHGLMLGADDYMEKPFGFRELEARIRVVIKRKTVTNNNILAFEPLNIDIANRRVLCNGDEILLTVREYDLLVMMATCEEPVITYEKIGMFLWNSYRAEDRASVMVNVSRLRKKMEVDPLCSRLIETVWSKGYSFNGGNTK